jgi:O-antigen ligase
MKKITLDNIINAILFFYIISIYLLTYRDGFNFISNILALLLIGTIWVNFLIARKKLVFNKSFITYLLFILICLISVFYAIDLETSLEKVKTLVLIFVLMVSIANYVNTIKKLKKVMSYFVISGFLASAYILLNSDFSEISRFGGDLGNVNSIGMIICISSAFNFYFIIEERKYSYVPMIAVNFVVILLTGSRIALLFFAFSTIILLTFRGKGIKSKFKNILEILVILLLTIYLIFNIPIFYKIIGIRIENLFSFASGGSANEGSVYIRAHMIEVGLGWFKERPFTGYGIDNFRYLFSAVAGGDETYSHNNVIELLVGTGLFGTILYYLSYLIVLLNLHKASKIINKTLCYSFIAIILSYILMSIGSIYYYDKHISIVLSLGSIVYKSATKIMYQEGKYDVKKNNKGNQES